MTDIAHSPFPTMARKARQRDSNVYTSLIVLNISDSSEDDVWDFFEECECPAPVSVYVVYDQSGTDQPLGYALVQCETGRHTKKALNCINEVHAQALLANGMRPIVTKSFRSSEISGREQLMVTVTNISKKADLGDVYDLFSAGYSIEAMAIRVDGDLLRAQIKYSSTNHVEQALTLHREPLGPDWKELSVSQHKAVEETFTNVHLSGFAAGVTDEAVKALLEVYGPIRSNGFVAARDNGVLNHVNANFETHAAAASAVEALDQKPFEGVTIRCSRYVPPAERCTTPVFAMGFDRDDIDHVRAVLKDVGHIVSAKIFPPKPGKKRVGCVVFEKDVDRKKALETSPIFSGRLRITICPWNDNWGTK